MKQLHASWSPHRGFAAPRYQKTGIERAVAVKRLRRWQTHRGARCRDGVEQLSLARDFARIHVRATLRLDSPRPFNSIKGCRDLIEGILWNLPWQKPPIECETDLVLNRVRRRRKT